MAKQGQEHPDASGNNNPSKTEVITTGTGLTDNQAHAHHHEDEHPGRSAKADSRLMEQEGPKRSGSDSDAHGGRKQSRLHEGRGTSNHGEGQPHSAAEDAAEFDSDLRPNEGAGLNHGMDGQHPEKTGRTAADIKDLHTLLPNLTNDELRRLEVVPSGSRLQQGAMYIDLRHLDQGEFTARGDMEAAPGTDYVMKKDTDYVLWNRLTGVTDHARLDEA